MNSADNLYKDLEQIFDSKEQNPTNHIEIELDSCKDKILNESDGSSEEEEDTVNEAEDKVNSRI